MASPGFCRAGAAALFCAVPAAASPILDFDDTDFRARLEYNVTLTASSEEEWPQGQSLAFYAAGNEPEDNRLRYNGGTELWGLVTAQDPLAGDDPVEVTFDFQAQGATLVDAGSPLTIRIEALNTYDYQALAVAGSVWIDLETASGFAGPWQLPTDSGWNWEPTPNSRSNEYDLLVDLEGLTPADVFDGLTSNDEIGRMKVWFDVTVPEPPTFVLMAASIALCWRRRPR